LKQLEIIPVYIAGHERCPQRRQLYS
jgi:hypothetical protein